MIAAVPAGVPLFDTTADVYSPDPTTKKYTVLERSGLPCRLATNPTGVVSPQPERAEAMASRRFVWDAAYAMPKFVEVEVRAERWRLLPATHNRPASGPYAVAIAVKAGL